MGAHGWGRSWAAGGGTEAGPPKGASPEVRALACGKRRQAANDSHCWPPVLTRTWLSPGAKGYFKKLVVSTDSVLEPNVVTGVQAFFMERNTMVRQTPVLRWLVIGEPYA